MQQQSRQGTTAVPLIAFVQTKPGYELDDEDLTNFCRRHLASYKVPRIWRFVHQFPQTASGKIQKFILRAGLI